MFLWKMQRLCVTLKTPLRCGDRPMGFVARTLPFVPAHIPIMAMTPILVRRLQMSDSPSSYEKVLEFLQKHVRCTPLFLLDPQKEGVLIPGKKGGALGRIEALFLNSRHGVGMDYAPRGVRKGYLFEIEAISPISRSGAETQLQGYLFWKSGKQGDLEMTEEGKIQDRYLWQIMQDCQWGGERNKGYGCLRRVEAEDADNLWGAGVNRDGGTPLVVWPKDRAAPFYLLGDEKDTRDRVGKWVTGTLCPLLGRLYKPGEGFGQQSSHLICWDIGWLSQKAITLELGDQTAVAISVGD